MNRLEFEALKAKYPNRLRCFRRKEGLIVLIDLLTETYAEWWPEYRMYRININEALGNFKSLGHRMFEGDIIDSLKNAINWEEL